MVVSLISFRVLKQRASGRCTLEKRHAAKGGSEQIRTL
jgi:hypothetical protein